MVSKIKATKAINSINEFQGLDGDISNYYRKLWLSISDRNKLVDFFGLLSRINGEINPDFVSEWGKEDEVLFLFREQAMHLFDTREYSWVFFHNSFRQFLIIETSKNSLTSKQDRKKDIQYHHRLANLYFASVTEDDCKAFFHLFHSENYSNFLTKATPESFVTQLQNYRPIEEIRNDIRLGLKIGKLQNDIYIVEQYLFASSELERRLYNLNPTDFFEDFLSIGKPFVAKRYLRDRNQLLCSRKQAYEASRLFFQLNDIVEAKILYSLAEPDAIKIDRIYIDGSQRSDELKEILLEWASTAMLFESVDTILNKINNIQIAEHNFKYIQHDFKNLRAEMLFHSADLLSEVSRWNSFSIIIKQFDVKNENEKDSYFFLLRNAIELCLEESDLEKANLFLSEILNEFELVSLTDSKKIAIADLIFKVRNDTKLIELYLNEVKQPDSDRINYYVDDNELKDFTVRIKLNKLLNVLGKGQPITIAVPSSQDVEREIIVEFERMLCLITQILSDGLLKKQLTESIVTRTTPIIKFFYRSFNHHKRYWYKLLKARTEYFKFLVFAVSTLGIQEVERLMFKLIEEFALSPSYWPSDLRRSILIASLGAGFNKNVIKEQLLLLEKDMLGEQDISGKVKECQRHIKAWIELGEYNLAEDWIKKAIYYSTGVGYRKDYQFDTWIEWLEKVNEVEGEKSEQRIRWFLSKLQQIKDSTEGGAFHSAARALLQATFKFKNHWGFQQMVWQLDNRLINFLPAIEVAVEECTENISDKSSYELVRDIFVHIVFYLSEFTPRQLFKKFLCKGHNLFKDLFLQNELPNIIKQIQLRAVEENRVGFYRAIHEFLRANASKLEEVTG